VPRNSPKIILSRTKADQIMDRRGPRRSGPVRHQPDRTNTTSTIYGPCLWTAMPRLQREARYPSRLAVGRAASGLMVGAWSRRRAGDIRAADRTLTGKVQVGPSTRAMSACIRVKRLSAASAERRCSAARAAIGTPWRLPKSARTSLALSARVPLVNSAGPIPAANAISRHRQTSAMSVSLDRTVVARLFSTTALSSSANGNSQRSVSPLSRRSSIEIVTGGRASASCRPGTSVVKRSSPTRTFSRVLLV
jgi:hypothetical protein